MIPLNYNQLYYFYKIAELGSIAKASKALLVSSPALSMQLKELEDFLATKLFDRIGHKLLMTEAGRIVYEYAKDIFKLGYELRDTLNDRRTDTKRISIEIGCQDTIPKQIIDELLTYLIDKKKCKVILREGNQEKLLQLQRNYQLDLILTNAIPAIGNDFILDTRLLLRDSLFLVGNQKYKKNNRDFKSISKLPFILPTFDSSLRQKLDSFFQVNNLTLDIAAEVEDKASEIDLAQKGVGIMAMMKSLIPHYQKNKTLVPLYELKGVQEEIWMIIGKRKIINPLALYAMKNFQLTLSKT
jgi:LysR family transcriptional regulator, transcriptional activator of nhaA